MFTVRLDTPGTYLTTEDGEVVALVTEAGMEKLSDREGVLYRFIIEPPVVCATYVPAQHSYVRGLMALAPEHVSKFPSIYQEPLGLSAEVYRIAVRYNGRLHSRHAVEQSRYVLLSVLEDVGRTWIIDVLRITYARPLDARDMWMTDVVSGESRPVDGLLKKKGEALPSREDRPDLVVLASHYNCVWEAHEDYLVLRVLYNPLSPALLV